jgi:PKD repeat protein
MKKMYLSALFAAMSALAVAQSSFFVPTSYRGAFAPAPEAMWTDNWCNWDPQNTAYGTPTVNVTTSITNNTTWTSNNIYLLQGQIYVKNGATLTIQPGTVIMGDKATPGSGLFVTQGSQLIAQGTVNAPIVFTSNQAAGNRAAGDWGGVILLGRAANNQVGGIANIEGIAPSADTQFGGGANPDDSDNSGIMTYVRIEFPGYVYQTDKEINGLTFGSVGSGTTINNIQVSFSNDDAYEWFGGKVNAHHLVSYRNLDDDFDTDFGYRGNVQFGLIVRDPAIADNPAVSTSEGLESDNDATGTSNTPQTSAIFSNITAIGPYRGNTANTIAAGYRRAARLRRNTALRIYNSLFLDFKNGIYIDNTNPGAEANALSGLLKFKNNLIAGNSTGHVTEKIASSTFNITQWFATNSNDSLASTSGILITPYNYTAPDYRPAGSSPALTNFDFSDGVIAPFVLTAPVATASVSYCVNATASALTATATGLNSLKWYTVANGGTELGSAPVPSTTTAGVFTYYVAQANAEGTEGPRTLITVTVNALPATPIITPNGPTSFCIGGSVDLTASSSNSYLWNTTSIAQTITVTTSGNYHVQITDANGCQANSSDITVNVSNAPVPTIQTSGSTALCSGQLVTLTASTSESYTWSTGDTTQSIIVTSAGNYYVTSTNSNACDGVGQSANVVVTVAAQPVAIISSVSVNGTVVNFTNSSTDATAYSWDFGDFSSSSAVSPTHAFAVSGPYTVTLTATNGSCTDDTTFTVSIVAGIETLNNSIGAQLYPNPTAENTTLSFNLSTGDLVSVAVLNANGQNISSTASQYFEAGSHTIELEVNELSNGLYYAVIVVGNTTHTLKLSVLN